jgi:Flavodoxin domain
MRAVIVYESMFGSTKKVAEAIAEGLAGCAEVSVVPVKSAGVHILDGADLVLVGGPTHAHGMSRPGTRKMAGKLARKPGSEAELVPGAVSGPGVREWLASLGRLEVVGAAFDTRLQGLPAFTGRASKSIRRLLARHGARIAASPESFLVKGLTGALAEGELARARAWVEGLSGVTASEAPPGRRQAS